MVDLEMSVHVADQIAVQTTDLLILPWSVVTDRVFVGNVPLTTW